MSLIKKIANVGRFFENNFGKIVLAGNILLGTYILSSTGCALKDNYQVTRTPQGAEFNLYDPEGLKRIILKVGEKEYACLKQVKKQLENFESDNPIYPETLASTSYQPGPFRCEFKFEDPSTAQEDMDLEVEDCEGNITNLDVE